MKKFICLVMALMSFFTVTCYAGTTLTDIKDTKYEEAVEKLGTFEIVDGFDDNTFRPKEKVTRAQMAKMLVTSMGMQDEVEAAKKKYLDFSDVLSSYWGYGYIKVASDQKLVNGYGDGKFKPEGNVTYGEATTMVVRALGYEEEVQKSNLAWPNNYMSFADEELDLFDSITEFKAGDYATRGDIALLIWNALRTGVAEIVAENSSGLVYGPGTPMITEYLNYTYLEDAEVTRVLFDEEYKTAKVTFKEEGKKSQSFEFSAEDVLEMYGKSVTILFDEEKEEILSLEANTEYKTVQAEVTRISETKIYISSRTTGYKLPDEDNILLYGIEDFEDTCEVILLVDGNQAEYCIAMGASDVLAGIVIDDYVEIDEDEYGVKIRELDMTKGGEEYLLADEENWLSGDAIILYYISDDDLLVLLRVINEENANVIADIEEDYIKISNKLYYEFESEEDYTVIIVSGTKLKSAELADINIDRDLLYAVEYNTHFYFFVFEDAVVDSLDEDILYALEDLEYAIEDAEELDEEEYSQESFAKLMNAVIDGKEISYKSTITKIKNTIEKIENAIDELEKVSRREKDIVAMKKELRAFIADEAEDIIEDEDDYTSDSFEDFYEAYEDAVTVLSWTNATLDEVETVYEDLEYAIEDLEEK